MVESGEVHEKIDKILTRVESMDNFMPWIVRPQANEIKKQITELLQKKRRAAKVYLAIEGQKTVTELATVTSIAQPNVTAEVNFLVEVGLVDKVIIGKNTFCRKNKIDRVLGLTKHLQRTFGVSAPAEEVKDEGNQGDTNTVSDTQANENAGI